MRLLSFNDLGRTKTQQMRPDVMNWWLSVRGRGGSGGWSSHFLQVCKSSMYRLGEGVGLREKEAG